MSVEIRRYFDRYGWALEEPEPGIFRVQFSSENEEDFDLYALIDDGWLRLAVTPLMPRPDDSARGDLHASLLEANVSLTGVRFGVDGDGDVTLHADLPTIHLTHAQFAAVLDQMVGVVNVVAGKWRL